MSVAEAAVVISKLPPGMSRDEFARAAKSIKRAVVLRTMWYPEIMDELERTAVEFLLASGVASESIELRGLPGSLELPLAAQQVAKAQGSKRTADVIVALGCVIQGDTPHFEHVCRAAMDGLMRVQLDTGVPIGCGLLTVNSREQAEARKSKGAESAQAALAMYALSRRGA